MRYLDEDIVANDRIYLPVVELTEYDLMQLLKKFQNPEVKEAVLIDREVKVAVRAVRNSDHSRLTSPGSIVIRANFG